MNYSVLAQNRDEMLDAANSPSLTIWPYLLQTDQTKLLNSISIYTDKGTSREQARLFYMNATALKLWGEMQRPITIIGTQHRPPKSAVLAYGMPFSE
jgi:hypothetical protein